MSEFDELAAIDLRRLMTVFAGLPLASATAMKAKI